MLLSKEVCCQDWVDCGSTALSTGYRTPILEEKAFICNDLGCTEYRWHTLHHMTFVYLCNDPPMPVNDGAASSWVPPRPPPWWHLYGVGAESAISEVGSSRFFTGD